MASSNRSLPSRFPDGTKFVIEGRSRGEGQVQVYSRYLEFPDGTRIRLPLRPGKRASGAKSAAARRRTARARVRRS
jgi:hypothetical protein